MFRTLTDFISDITGGQRDTEAFGADDYRLAAAALLVHVVSIDGEMSDVERDKVKIYDRENNPVSREIVESGASAATIEKGNYRHYMQKEIFEQPVVVGDTLSSYLRTIEAKVALPDIDFDLSAVNRVTIVIRVPVSVASNDTSRRMVGISGSGSPSGCEKPSSMSSRDGASTSSVVHQPGAFSPSGPVMW